MNIKDTKSEAITKSILDNTLYKKGWRDYFNSVKDLNMRLESYTSVSGLPDDIKVRDLKALATKLATLSNKINQTSRSI